MSVTRFSDHICNRMHRRAGISGVPLHCCDAVLTVWLGPIDFSHRINPVSSGQRNFRTLLTQDGAVGLQ
jgi:hypothetical protein